MKVLEKTHRLFRRFFRVLLIGVFAFTVSGCDPTPDYGVATPDYGVPDPYVVVPDYGVPYPEESETIGD